jgi:hypothetical protein
MEHYKIDFSFVLPLEKSYRDGDGFYHLAFSLSTSDQDLAGDIITETALDMMVEEAKHININANHEHGLKDIIGPVMDSWKETKSNTVYLWVDVRVRKQWTDIIHDLIESGTKLGGSIEGSITETIQKDGKSLINGIKLYGGALTDIPANWTTRGTATPVKNGCPGSLCTQIQKNIQGDNIKKIRNNVIKHAKSLIEKENIQNGEWDDTNATIDDYKELAVVIDPTLDPETKNAYSYLLGKNSKIYSKALSAALAYTNGASGAPKYPELAKELESLSKILQINEEKQNMDDKALIKKMRKEMEKFWKKEDATPLKQEDLGDKFQKKLEKLENEKKELHKTIKEDNNLINKLKTEKEELKKIIEKNKHNELVQKAIQLTRKLDPKTQVIDEDCLMEELKKEFTTQDLETPDNSIQTYIKSLEIILKKLPEGSIPEVYDNTLQKQQDAHHKNIIKLNKKIAQMGQKTMEG